MGHSRAIGTASNNVRLTEVRMIVEMNAAHRPRLEELEAANRELEAFSYSVAHDLRAPLRSIDGFSLALLEDYGDDLGKTGRDYLRRLREAGLRMGQLVDDLLELAQATHGAGLREVVDLGYLAREIAEGLRRGEPDRRVRFVIEEGLTAEGDARLLRVVLENLLGNAWKFTSRQPEARIEVGEVPGEGGGVYYVRDDGVGFDPARADEIFEPFRRLHGDDEFDGTGVGLATVERAIRRHGGKVWARGAVGQGATFFFTLGIQTPKSATETYCRRCAREGSAGAGGSHTR